MEAMAAGCRVVTSRLAWEETTAGFAELVEVDAGFQLYRRRIWSSVIGRCGGAWRMRGGGGGGFAAAAGVVCDGGVSVGLAVAGVGAVAAAADAGAVGGGGAVRGGMGSMVK